jgi:protein TonB
MMLSATALAVALVGGVAAQERVYLADQQGAGLKNPVLVREVKPNYTEAAKDHRVVGTVELTAIVLKDGTVGDVTIKRSLDPDLDAEAIKATKKWEFRPGTKDGEPVNVQVNIELTFTLR